MIGSCTNHERCHAPLMGKALLLHASTRSILYFPGIRRPMLTDWPMACRAI